jgi:hypothetical protein
MSWIKSRLVIAGVLLVFIIGIHIGLDVSVTLLKYYQLYVFLPLQQIRNVILNVVPFSVGDLLYAALIVYLLYLLGQLVFFVLTFKKNRNALLRKGLQLSIYLLGVYLSFLLLWGGNYSRPALTARWDIPSMEWGNEQLCTLAQDLLVQMNDSKYAGIATLDDNALNKILHKNYLARFGNCVPNLQVKATWLGSLLYYMGVQGYYNPFTGEGQFNQSIPAYMHPFVIAHEMAHQAGIAAEDDANLIAYVLCRESEEPALEYSAHFNLFLYVYSELKVRDKEAARDIFEQLSEQSKQHYEELRTLNRRYRGRFRKMSNSLYNEYLRMQGQSDGLETYSYVSRWVYYWYFQKKKKDTLEVCPL